MNDLTSAGRRPDLYRSITESIITAIKAGAGPSQRPWYHAGSEIPANAATGARYRGINVVALWAEATQRHYASHLWASYMQWQSINAQVRKGERSTMIVFYKKLDDESAEDWEGSRRFVARASRVFNAQQVEGFVCPPDRRASELELNQEAESFVAALGADVRHGYLAACYRPSVDAIEMPGKGAFIGTITRSASQGYYGVLLHELTHWSGAPHRLAREMGKRFGDHAYAMEELVAELGAAFLCSSLGIAAEPRPDHAAYIATWLEVLNRDHRAIFSAASRAQDAFQYLVDLASVRTTLGYRS